ncbi:sentrin-specific protease 8 [Aphelenchoides avenae]|nr:sentrin-specific protease 8 [Aphelenchus avenae]KAH7729120.1 sentrin-specific protease 8 [Aphelenchus avenae]
MSGPKEKKVLAYEDIVLYESDLRSLTGKHAWLTDNIVSFAATYILDTMLKSETKDKVCVVLPSLCQMIKYVEADNELAALVESFGVRADRWCFFLLNDSTDPNVPCAGSHWILVVYDPLKKSVGVLDSMSSVVDEGTRQFVRRMRTVLGILDSSITSVSCPKMGNSGDCGMFTIEYLRAYLLNLDRGAADNFNLQCISDSYIADQRKEWANVIEQLGKNS